MIHYENYQTEFKGKESYTEVVGEIQNIICDFSKKYDLDKHELYYLKYHIDTLIDDIINIQYPNNKNEIKKINIIIKIFKNFLERGKKE